MIPKEGELMTASETEASVRAISCECGYRPKEDERCFTEEPEGFLFTCPNCGQLWFLRLAGKVN